MAAFYAQLLLSAVDPGSKPGGSFLVTLVIFVVSLCRALSFLLLLYLQFYCFCIYSLTASVSIVWTGQGDRYTKIHARGRDIEKFRVGTLSNLETAQNQAYTPQTNASICYRYSQPKNHRKRSTIDRVAKIRFEIEYSSCT